MSCNCLTNIEYEEAFATKTRTAEIGQKTILTLNGLDKGQLIQLDDVTRIKLALRNQGQLASFVCYLVSKVGNFAVDVTEII